MTLTKRIITALLLAAPLAVSGCGKDEQKAKACEKTCWETQKRAEEKCGKAAPGASEQESKQQYDCWRASRRDVDTCLLACD